MKGNNANDLITNENQNYYDTLFKIYIERDIISTCNIIMSSEPEGIMNTILKQVHKYKISAPSPNAKDQRYHTFVPDDTKPNGLRCIKKNSMRELELFLLEFYAIGDKRYTFENCYFDWIEYKKIFSSSNNDKKKLSPSTIRRMQRDYDTYIKGTPLASHSIRTLTPTIIENYLTDIIKKDYYSSAKDKKNKTNAHRMYESAFKNLAGYIKNALEYAFKKDKISCNPWSKVDTAMLLALTDLSPVDTKTDADRILSNEELSALYKEVTNQQKLHKHYLPNYAIELAILTGMRVGEIVALHWSDIYDGVIHVDWSEHRYDYEDKSYEYVIGEPKNRKHRVIPITPQIENLFERIKELNHFSNEGFIFVDEEGNRHSGHDVGCAVYRRGDEANISRTSIHGIRRTYSSMLQASGYSRLMVSTLLGHTPRTNEDHYSYDVTSITAKKQVIEAMSSNVLKITA